MKKQLAIAASIAISATLLTAAPVDARAVWRPNLPACAQEDGPGPCVWDAKHRGDHHGHSIWITRKDRVIFISHRKAHGHHLKKEN